LAEKDIGKWHLQTAVFFFIFPKILSIRQKYH